MLISKILKFGIIKIINKSDMKKPYKKTHSKNKNPKLIQIRNAKIESFIKRIICKTILNYLKIALHTKIFI